MAITAVTDAENYTDIFRRQVLLNTHYWQQYVNKQINTIESLENERDRIIKGIFFALDLDEAWPSVRELIVSFSSYMERRGYWDIWHRILKRAIEVAQDFGDISAVTNISALFARLLFQQGYFQEAVACYRQTIRMARQTGDQFNEARACTNLGYYYVEHGQWHRAEVLCCHALNIFEQIDNDHGRAHTENHLGVLYRRQHRYEEAQHSLERACTTWQAMGDHHGLMRGYVNLGALYIKQEIPDRALIYLNKALELANLTGDKTTTGIIFENIGLASIVGNNLIKAEAYARRAETIFRQSSNLAELARVWEILGAIYFRRDQYSKAILQLENSLEVWRSLSNVNYEINTLVNLVEYELANESRGKADSLLKEVERLVESQQKNALYDHLQSRLHEFRRSLAKSLP